MDSDLSAVESFVAVPVDAFPFAHGPFKCPHYERFCELERSNPDAPEGVVGEQWFQTLTAADFAACEFHEADWRTIAATSVAILTDAEADVSKRDLSGACADYGLPGRDRNWLFLMFAEPILWRPGSPCVENGQHRLCALRAAGAESVVADTEGRRP